MDVICYIKHILRHEMPNFTFINQFLDFFHWHIYKPCDNFYYKYVVTDLTITMGEFKKRLGYRLNIENPQTFNEKIQWLKLNSFTELHTQCSDKYQVRKYVTQTIGNEYLIPLLFQTADIRQLVPENIPAKQFVIKANHDCGSAIVVKDSNNLDWNVIRNKLQISLDRNFYYHLRELQYKNIKPRIVVEQLLLNGQGFIPDDHKMHCFNGKVKIIEVHQDRYTDHRLNWYKPDWTPYDFSYVWPRGIEAPKPDNLSKLIEVAEKLAKPFIYVRVDLYTTGQQIYFGELTFTPAAGMGVFTPIENDRACGDLLDISDVLG